MTINYQKQMEIFPYPEK